MLTFTFSWVAILTLIVGTVLPLLVGLVTSRFTHSGWKAIILAALSLVTGVLGSILNAVQLGLDYDIGLGLLGGLGTFLVAVGMHFGIWKPTGVSEKAQDTFRSKSEPRHLDASEPVDGMAGGDHV